MTLTGYARLHGVSSEERFKDIVLVCLDRNESGGREAIFPPEQSQVREAYFLHFENAYPLSEDCLGVAIHGRYSSGDVVPFKWPWELNNKRQRLPWQVMGVPAGRDGLYFKIHDDDLDKIRKIAIKSS